MSLRCRTQFPSKVSRCRDDDDEDEVAPRRRQQPPAAAGQRGSRGEDGAAGVPRHQHVTDVPLAAGGAHLAGGGGARLRRLRRPSSRRRATFLPRVHRHVPGGRRRCSRRADSPAGPRSAWSRTHWRRAHPSRAARCSIWHLEGDETLTSGPLHAKDVSSLWT